MSVGRQPLTSCVLQTARVLKFIAATGRDFKLFDANSKQVWRSLKSSPVPVSIATENRNAKSLGVARNKSADAEKKSDEPPAPTLKSHSKGKQGVKPKPAQRSVDVLLSNAVPPSKISAEQERVLSINSSLPRTLALAFVYKFQGGDYAGVVALWERMKQVDGSCDVDLLNCKEVEIILNSFAKFTEIGSVEPSTSTLITEEIAHASLRGILELVLHPSTTACFRHAVQLLSAVASISSRLQMVPAAVSTFNQLGLHRKSMPRLPNDLFDTVASVMGTPEAVHHHKELSVFLQAFKTLPKPAAPLLARLGESRGTSVAC